MLYPQKIDANIQGDYHTVTNDLENIEPDHQAGLKDLTHKIEQLWLTVEAGNNDPMDAISHFEHKLHQLALTFCLPTHASRTHWGSSQQIHKHFM